MRPSFTPVVAAEIFDLRPDYTAISVIAEGIDNLESHPSIDRYVEETMAHQVVPPWAEEHLESWRATFRAFGAKPQRTPCSAEALLARIRKDRRLPTINAIVDLYNAVSVRYAIPIGGENIATYVGNPRLVRATGSEVFDTTKDGQSCIESVPAGEVVWTDDRSVTCRRWNWRQGVRTRIDLQTREAWFILERLEPMPSAAALEAANALMDLLRQMSPGARLLVDKIDRHGSAHHTTPQESAT